MSDGIEISPALLAECDQELAAADVALNLLVVLYRQRAGEWDMDRLRRTGTFALMEIAPQVNVSGALTLLTIAIERLSKATP